MNIEQLMEENGIDKAKVSKVYLINDVVVWVCQVWHKDNPSVFCSGYGQGDTLEQAFKSAIIPRKEDYK